MLRDGRARAPALDAKRCYAAALETETDVFKPGDALQ